MRTKKEELKYLEDLCKAVLRDKGYTYIPLVGYDYWIKKQADKLNNLGVAYDEVLKILEKYKVYKK